MDHRTRLLQMLAEEGDPRPEETLARFEEAIRPRRLADFKTEKARARLEARLRWFRTHQGESDDAAAMRVKKALREAGLEIEVVPRILRFMPTELIRTWDPTAIREVVEIAKRWAPLALFFADPSYREAIPYPATRRIEQEFRRLAQVLARKLGRREDPSDALDAVHSATVTLAEGEYTFEKPLYTWIWGRARSRLKPKKHESTSQFPEKGEPPGMTSHGDDLEAGGAGASVMRRPGLPGESGAELLRSLRGRYLLVRTTFRNTALVDAIFRQMIGLPGSPAPKHIASDANVHLHRRRLRIRLDAVRIALEYNAYSEHILMLSLVAGWGGSAEDERKVASRLGALARIARRDQGVRTLPWAIFATLVVDRRCPIDLAWERTLRLGRPRLGPRELEALLARARDETLRKQAEKLLQDGERHLLSAVWFGLALAEMTPEEVRIELCIHRDETE